jgi:hypothetical protein
MDDAKVEVMTQRRRTVIDEAAKPDASSNRSQHGDHAPAGHVVKKLPRELESLAEKVADQAPAARLAVHVPRLRRRIRVHRFPKRQPYPKATQASETPSPQPLIIRVQQGEKA